VRCSGSGFFYIDPQKGSHVVLKSADDTRTIVVPDHPEIDRGTLKAILKQAGIDIPALMKVLMLLPVIFLFCALLRDPAHAGCLAQSPTVCLHQYPFLPDKKPPARCPGIRHIPGIPGDHMAVAVHQKSARPLRSR